MSRIVVTGARGFLGRHAVAALLRRGYEVHGLGRGDASPGIPGRVTWHSVDLMDRDRVRAVLEPLRAEGLIHFAWTTRHGEYWSSPENLDWVAASLGLFRRFREFGGQRIVVAGSSAEYDWSARSPFDEATTPLRPASLYGTCKNCLREMTEAWATACGVSWAWGRLFNIFGPFEPAERLVPRVLNGLQAGRELPFDDGSSVRDFLHVADAGEAFAALYASGFQGVVNVASGVPLTVREMVTEIARELDQAERVKFGAIAAARDAPAILTASVTRIRNATGWAPALGLREAVHDTCLWWRDQAPDSQTYR